MRISKNKQQKIFLATSLAENYGQVEWVFFVNYSGLNASDTYDLRCKLREVNAVMQVIKNKVNNFAMAKTNFNIVKDDLKGQVATIMTTDPVTVAKIIAAFVKNEKLSLVTYTDGKNKYSSDQLGMLASLPPMDVLRAQLLATLLSPMSNLARILNEPGSALARIMQTKSKE